MWGLRMCCGVLFCGRHMWGCSSSMPVHASPDFASLHQQVLQGLKLLHAILEIGSYAATSTRHPSTTHWACMRTKMTIQTQPVT